MLRNIARVLPLLLILFASPVRADVLVTNYFNNSIERFDQTTGADLGTFIPNGLGGLSEPAGIVYNPADNLIYISSQGNNEILRYNLNGTFNSVFANLTPINAQYAPAGLRFSPTNGDLYVSRFGTIPGSVFPAAGQGTVDQFNKTTGAFVQSVMSGMSGANAVLFTPNGDLYGSSLQSQSPSQSPDGLGYVNKVPNGGSQAYYVAPETSSLETASGLAAVPGTNNIAVVDLFGGAIHEYDASGNQLADLIAPGGVLNGVSPSDVMFTSPTTMWVATLGSADPGQPGAPNGSVMLFDLSSSTPQTPFMTTSGFYAGEFAIAPVAVPEPGTLLFVGGAGIAGLLARRRRKR